MKNMLIRNFNYTVGFTGVITIPKAWIVALKYPDMAKLSFNESTKEITIKILEPGEI